MTTAPKATAALPRPVSRWKAAARGIGSLIMADDAKSLITDTVVGQGHSESYGQLLYTFSLLGPDLELFVPDSEEELTEWRGYRKGLCSALTCLAMFERGIEPEQAAWVVEEQIESAVALVGCRRAQGVGG